MRRVRTLVVGSALAAVLGAHLAAAQPGPITVTGHFTEALSCCEVEIVLNLGAASVTVTSAPDGTFEAVLPCLTSDWNGDTILDDPLIEVFARCCTASTSVLAAPCGMPQAIDVELTCGDPPTLHSRIEGSVLCRDGIFLEPVADSPVLIETGPGSGAYFVRTGADGSWSACIECAPMGPTTVTVTAQGCDLETTFDLVGCPPQHPVPAFVCDPCPVPACPTPGDVLATGSVHCTDPGGSPEPIPDCLIWLGAQDSCTGPRITAETTTGPDGIWTSCIPCQATPDCPVWVIDVGWGCGCVFPAPEWVTVLGCPSVVNASDYECMGPGAGCPPVVPSCPSPTEAEWTGTVTCFDLATGTFVPVAGCPVVVEPLGCGEAPFTVVTAADGTYSACVPCPDCASVRVTATCCGATATGTTGACDLPHVLDLACGDCAPPRPCGPDAIEASGRVTCTSGSGGPTPLAGCAVVLLPRDAGGSPLPPVTALTGGDGGYTACVPCDPAGLSQVEATSACCTETSVTLVSGCPATVELDDVECSGCSPCLPDMTRLQGRVHCRGGGPVADCEVEILVTTCAGDLTFTTRTDRQGRYRLCVPCPCADTLVRVTAACCPGTRTVLVDGCGPVTPVPTLTCAGGCP